MILSLSPINGTSASKRRMESSFYMSDRQKKQAKASKEVTTSEEVESKELPPESLGFTKVNPQEMMIGEFLTALKPTGVKMAISINGVTTAQMKVKLSNGNKRQQSIPPGDLLVIVLPKSETKRKAGYAIVKLKE